jgi:uncharacterized Zn-binding protein involved in type VI secretion
MKRYFLKVGDRSTAGGFVTEGDATTTHHGTALTYLGARVSCPACNSEGRIIPSGPRRPFIMMGKDAALDGDLCGCKCIPPPEMRASQDSMWEEFGGAELDTRGFTANGTPIERPPTGTFDERLRIVDDRQQPLARVPYHIRTSRGRTYKGITDASGYCPRVYTETADTLDIALGMKALDRWEK